MNRLDNADRPRLEAKGVSGAVEAAVSQVLERQPKVAIPADFATRVTAVAMAQPVRRRLPWAGFGARMAMVSMAVLMVALFAFAPHATPSVMDLRFDLEMVALAELGLVGYVVTRVGLRG